MKYTARFLCLTIFFVGSSIGCSTTSMPKTWNPFAGSNIKGDPLVAYEKTDLQSEKIEALKLVSYEESSAAATSEKLTQFLAKEQHPIVRANLINTLAAYNTEKSNLALKLSMEDPSPIVRSAGCKAWATRTTPEAVQALSDRAIKDSEVDVRIAAIRALSGYKDNAEVLKTYAITLDDRDPAVQYNTMTALGQVTGKDFGGQVSLWKDYLSGNEPQEPGLDITSSIYKMYRSF